MNSEQLIALSKEFIHNATTYNMEYIDAIYSDAIVIVMVDENDGVATFNKQQLLDYFGTRNREKAAPLSQDATFLYAEGDEHSAMVIVSREMTFNQRPEKMLFTLLWENTNKGWQVVRESCAIRPL